MHVTILIDLPVQKVYPLFMDTAFYREWKKDMVGFEPVGGVKGETGAVTKLAFRRGVMIETIVSKDVPNEFIAKYEHVHGQKVNMVHAAVNRFSTVGAGQTRIDCDLTTLEINGLFRRVMMKLFEGAGRKYAQSQLEKFKHFAEHYSSGI